MKIGKPDPEILRNMLKLFKGGKCWGKGSLHHRSPKGYRETWCLVGAYNQSIYGTTDLCDVSLSTIKSTANHPELDLIQKVIDEQFYGKIRPRMGHVPIVSFNDASETKWNDIEMVMEKAIVQAEEQV